VAGESDSRTKFEGLADDYDLFRPRYPRELIQRVVEMIPMRQRLTVVDAGAGTGIALEGLKPLLGADCRYQAVDLSADMVARGRAKFPDVDWHVDAAEAFLERAANIDLILAAQSFQWMDRPRFLDAANRCLKPWGVLAILQNNRNSSASRFLDAYESLLEELSPGYRRDYRDFDLAGELEAAFVPDGGKVEVAVVDWIRTMPQDHFIGMVRSSTQAQRALQARGGIFLERLAELVDVFSMDGLLSVPYRSELVLGQKDRTP